MSNVVSRVCEYAENCGIFKNKDLGRALQPQLLCQHLSVPSPPKQFWTFPPKLPARTFVHARACYYDPGPCDATLACDVMCESFRVWRNYKNQEGRYEGRKLPSLSVSISFDLLLAAKNKSVCQIFSCPRRSVTKVHPSVLDLTYKHAALLYLINYCTTSIQAGKISFDCSSFFPKHAFYNLNQSSHVEHAGGLNVSSLSLIKYPST